MPLLLKSLELQGYKTFASRTIFEYAGTITAIVGPNGSGKSNIADSMRWVLGEQSFTLLRGRKTEDMIFSGSELRSRAGMASATMTFDNIDGWLPIDFSEVAVTRRAYRDGQNEYLINGQRVRLKDVNELLAKSGLAERTYTVIGQGLVDAALALKAEERRLLFEEAAGIGLYRSRREEAMRRLDTTHRNLERVKDILVELEPRLRSLERQARKVQEYEQLKQDLKVLLLEWYGYHWHREQKELAQSIEQARLHQVEVKKARQDQGHFNEIIQQKRKIIQDKRAQLSALRTELVKLTNEREELSRDLAVLTERLRSQSREAENLDLQIEQAKEERDFTQELVEQAGVEHTRLQAEYWEQKEQADLAQKKLAEQKQLYDQKNQELEEVRASIQELVRKIAEVQAREIEQRNRIQRLGQAQDERNLAIRETNRQMEDHQKQLSQIQAQLDEKKIQAQDQEKMFSELVEQETELVHNKERRNQKKLELSAEYQTIQTQLNYLDEAEKSLLGYSSGAQTILKEYHDRGVGDFVGVISQLLEVPEEYEIPIGAVLGELADAAVVQKMDNSEGLIDLLTDHQARGVIIPLDAVQRTEKKGRIVGDQGVIGWCSQLITAPEPVRPAVEALLGNILLVKDRAAARQELSKGKRDFTVVTLKGEIYFPQGHIVAGVESNPGTLKRPRQKKEWAGRLSLIEQKIAGEEKELIEIGCQLTENLVKKEKLTSQIEILKKQIDEYHQRAREQQAQISQFSSRMEWQQKALADEQLEVTDLEKKIANQLDAQKTASLDLEARQEEAKKLASDLNNFSIDYLKSQVIQAGAFVKSAERSLQESQIRLDERQASLAKSREVISARQARIEELKRLHHDLEQEASLKKEDESKLIAKIDQTNATLTPLQEQIMLAESELEKQIDDDNRMQRQIVVLEQKYAQASIQQARQQEKFDSLQRKIEEDFGLVVFDYSEEISGHTPLPIDGMVEKLPQVAQISAELDETIKRERAQLRRMGAINTEAKSEFEEVKRRYEFMIEQVADLEKAEADIKEIINELDRTMLHDFRSTFEAVAEEFRVIFGRLFEGGSARILMTDPEDITQTGIEIEARLPGRRLQGLSLLSGGERSLTAVALIFALLKVSPTPFCVLDEVDAMLDETNVGRFRDLLKELSQNTQFIIVTHNRNTVQVADVIYGVTMGRDSSSQVISLRLDELEKVIQIKE